MAKHPALHLRTAGTALKILDRLPSLFDVPEIQQRGIKQARIIHLRGPEDIKIVQEMPQIVVSLALKNETDVCLLNPSIKPNSQNETSNEKMEIEQVSVNETVQPIKRAAEETISIKKMKVSTSVEFEECGIYLDSAASTKLDAAVFQSMIPHFLQNYANPSSAHQFGKDSHDFLESSRKIIASSINAEPNEIVFTASGTEANNLALKGIVEHHISQKNTKLHIITTGIEHDSITETCKALQSLYGYFFYFYFFLIRSSVKRCFW